MDQLFINFMTIYIQSKKNNPSVFHTMYQSILNKYQYEKEETDGDYLVDRGYCRIKREDEKNSWLVPYPTIIVSFTSNFMNLLTVAFENQKCWITPPLYQTFTDGIRTHNMSISGTCITKRKLQRILQKFSLSKRKEGTPFFGSGTIQSSPSPVTLLKYLKNTITNSKMIQPQTDSWKCTWIL